jgi:hypothetical protein
MSFNKDDIVRCTAFVEYNTVRVEKVTVIGVVDAVCTATLIVKTNINEYIEFAKFECTKIGRVTKWKTKER